MTERRLEDFAVGEKLSRRSLVARATFFGAAMAAIGDVAKAQEDGSGSYSNAAIALPDSSVAAKTREEQIRAVRIARAMRAGPSVITAPGLCYMLCGATQHSNTDAHDRTSPAIPIARIG
jgi:hypothetical protein